MLSNYTRAGTPSPVVARAIAGDAEVIAPLLESQRPRIVGLARFFTGNAADAEDLAHDILIRVMQGLPTSSGRRRSTRGSIAPAATAASITSAAADWKRRFRPRRTGASALGRRSRPPDESVSWRSQRASERALETLPPAWRQAVVLRDLEELSYEEVAERLSLPLGTVKSQISRGRSRLAHALVH